jgi:hypothetical protein
MKHFFGQNIFILKIETSEAYDHPIITEKINADIMMRVSKFAALTSQDAKYKTTCF